MGCNTTTLTEQLKTIPSVEYNRTDRRYRISVDTSASSETKTQLHNLIKHTTGMIWREETDGKLTYTIIIDEPAEATAH